MSSEQYNNMAEAAASIPRRRRRRWPQRGLGQCTGPRSTGRISRSNTTIETIDNNYLPLLKIPLVAGRNFFSRLSRDSTQSVLVNETFAREAAGRSRSQDVSMIRQERQGHWGDQGPLFPALQWKLKAQVFSLTLGRGSPAFHQDQAEQRSEGAAVH